MSIVLDGDAGQPFRIAIPTAGGKGCLAERLARRGGLVSGQVVGNAPSDGLGHRDPEPVGQTSKLPVLIGRELYLGTDHNVTLMPSCRHVKA